jgi:hypothetical protein
MRRRGVCSYYRRTSIEQLDDLPDDPWDGPVERLQVRLLGPNKDQIEKARVLSLRRSSLRQKWGSDLRIRMGDLDCSMTRSRVCLDRYSRDIDEIVEELQG